MDSTTTKMKSLSQSGSTSTFSKQQAPKKKELNKARTAIEPLTSAKVHLKHLSENDPLLRSSPQSMFTSPIFNPAAKAPKLSNALRSNDGGLSLISSVHGLSVEQQNQLSDKDLANYMSWPTQKPVPIVRKNVQNQSEEGRFRSHSSMAMLAMSASSSSSNQPHPHPAESYRTTGGGASSVPLQSRKDDDCQHQSPATTTTATAKARHHYQQPPVHLQMRPLEEIPSVRPAAAFFHLGPLQMRRERLAQEEKKRQLQLEDEAERLEAVKKKEAEALANRKKSILANQTPTPRRAGGGQHQQSFSLASSSKSPLGLSQKAMPTSSSSTSPAAASSATTIVGSFSVRGGAHQQQLESSSSLSKKTAADPKSNNQNRNRRKEQEAEEEEEEDPFPLPDDATSHHHDDGKGEEEQTAVHHDDVASTPTAEEEADLSIRSAGVTPKHNNNINNNNTAIAVRTPQTHHQAKIQQQDGGIEESEPLHRFRLQSRCGSKQKKRGIRPPNPDDSSSSDEGEGGIHHRRSTSKKARVTLSRLQQRHIQPRDGQSVVMVKRLTTADEQAQDRQLRRAQQQQQQNIRLASQEEASPSRAGAGAKSPSPAQTLLPAPRCVPSHPLVDSSRIVFISCRCHRPVGDVMFCIHAPLYHSVKRLLLSLIDRPVVELEFQERGELKVLERAERAVAEERAARAKANRPPSGIQVTTTRR